jgi:hypothetical protein
VTEDVKKTIAELNEHIHMLDRKFTLYFSGLEKKSPVKEFEKLKGEVTRSLQMKDALMSASTRFFVNSFKHRFASYRTKWEKTLRAIEDGRFNPGKKDLK